MKWFCFCSVLLFASAVLGDAKAVIEGPETAEKYQSILLKATGSVADDVTWYVWGPSGPVEFEKYKACDEGTSEYRCRVQAMREGQYLIVLAVSSSDADDGSTVSLTTKIITVGKAPPVPDDPDEPDDPTPPKPRPELTGVAKTHFEAVEKIAPDLSAVRNLAGNCRQVASKAAGLSWKLEDIAREFILACRANVFTSEAEKTKWAPWIAAYGEQMEKSNTPTDAIESLNAIADGLEAYVTWKSPGVASSAPGSLLDLINGLNKNVSDVKSDASKVGATLNQASETLNRVKSEVGQ